MPTCLTIRAGSLGNSKERVHDTPLAVTCRLAGYGFVTVCPDQIAVLVQHDPPKNTNIVF